MKSRIKKIAVLLLVAAVALTAGFMRYAQTASAGTGNTVGSSQKWRIVTSAAVTYSGTLAKITVTATWQCRGAITSGYDSANDTYTITSNGDKSSSYKKNDYTSNKSWSNGETRSLGSHTITVNRRYTNYNVTVTTSLYHNGGASVGLKGTSSTTDVVTIAAMALPNKTVYYNANHNGPSGSSSTQAEGTGYPGCFIAQNGAFMYNGSNWTSSRNDNNFDLLDLTAIAKKNGYHVNAGQEWNTNTSGTGTTYSQSTVYTYAQITDGMTLYANWKPNSYTIRFNANGADSGVMPSQGITFDEKANAISNSFIRDGYKLRGWDRNPDADPAGTLDVVGDKGVISNTMLESYSNGETIDLYAIWRPLLKSEAQIYAGKIVNEGTSDPTWVQTDSYRFRLEPLEGMTTDNESTYESGHPLTADQMPMPEGTPEEQMYSEVDVTGLKGNPDMLRTQAFELINFEEPGWYMYRITEIPDPVGSDDIKYDKTSYFITCYVQYEQDTGWAAEVSSTTAYHNRNGIANHRPDTRDISAVTDNNGIAASDNDGSPVTAREKETFGKTGIGHQTIVAVFFNEEDADSDIPILDLLITKNLKGNLGDRTKKFEYTAEISGLAPNTSYAFDNEGAELTCGFTGRPGRESIAADDEGVAYIKFKLRDDEAIYIRELPLNTKIEITEDSSDHIPGYRVYTDDGTTVREGHKLRGESISTGIVTLSKSDTVYTALFENYRDLAANTGVVERGLPVAGAATVLIAGLAFVLHNRRKRKKILDE